MVYYDCRLTLLLMQMILWMAWSVSAGTEEEIDKHGRSLLLRGTHTSTSDEVALLQFKRDALGELTSPQDGTSERLSNWGSSSAVTDFCDWTGVTCDAGRRVVALNITDIVLNGTLSSALANLTLLQNLTLHRTHLKGTIPPELGHLASLRYLDLWGNNLTGSIPATLGNCTNLKSLIVTFNRLSGPLPPELGNLTQLETLDFKENTINGLLPDSLGNCANLRELVGRTNKLIGGIPESLGNCTRLASFDFEDNDMDGPFPESFGRLQELSRIMVRFNRFSGGIGMLGNCSRMQFLYLSYNQFNGTLPPFPGQKWDYLENYEGQNNAFSGEIPPALTARNCTALKNVVFGNNNLTGTISPRFGNCPILESLQFWNNNLTGSIPKELGGLPNFRLLYLSNNSLLHGPIPASLANCPRLGTILLQGTKNMNGTLPVEFGSMPALESLVVTDAKLHGAIPLLCNVKSMSVLALNGNNLTGDIPVSISRCVNLTNLLLQNNRLTGSIPDGFGSLRSLQRLWLENNNLTGVIPSSLGRCTMLHDLQLNDNSITGEIPPSLSNCSNLTRILLSNNKLSGKLTKLNFTKLRALEVLTSANNSIEGTIPDALITCENLTILDLSRNNLSGELPTSPSPLLLLQKLRVLILESNDITGVIPDWIWSLKNVSVLDLSENRLTGPVSRNLSNLRGLVENVTLAELDAREVRPVVELNYDIEHRMEIKLSPFQVTLAFVFKGQVHSFTGNGLVWTTTLTLAGNNLTGDIPSDVLNLEYLKILNLSRNAFTGSIPDAPNHLPNLESLDLSSNRLTGRVPAMLPTMRSIQMFYLGGNNLSGEIPQENSFGTRWREENFKPGNDGLCGAPLITPLCSNGSSSSDIAPSMANLASFASWVEFNLSVRGLCVGAILGFGIGLGFAIGISSPLRHLLLSSSRRHKKRRPVTSAWPGPTQWWNIAQLHKRHSTLSKTIHLPPPTTA